jgi:murein DD-endopeptidase MepM/ murein hydrolase activator NlpD
MSFFETPEARVRRFGRWTLLLITAALPIVFLAALPLFSPAQGATLRQQLALKQDALDAAYAELDGLQAELDQLAEKHTAGEIRLENIGDDINNVDNEIALSQKDLKIAQAQLEDRLVGLYKDGHSAASSQYLEILFDDGDIVSVMERFSLVSRLADQDQELFNSVKGYLQQSEADQARLEEKKAEQTAQLQQLGALQQETSDKFEASAAQHQRIKRQINALIEDIRKADAAAAKAAAEKRARELAEKIRKQNNNSGGGSVMPWAFVFPVKGACSFIDSWGAWRSGGRTHKGTDVMAARGTPLVACVTGTITSASFSDSGLGGISLHLKGSHNDNWYYAHLVSIADGIRPGVSVSAGQVIGYVGDTGNAKGGAYHLHFGLTLNGTAINPYSTLRAARG